MIGMKARPLAKDLNADTDESTRAGRLSNSAGQSGDTQGLFDTEEVDSESVKELLEEGQLRGRGDQRDRECAASRCC